MNVGKFVKYAVWFNSRPDRQKCKEYAMDMLWKETQKDWTLEQVSAGEAWAFQCFYEVGQNFYLLFAESHWSPGDVSGSLMHYGQRTGCKGDFDEVMAVRLDAESYIPFQGLKDPSGPPLSLQAGWTR